MGFEQVATQLCEEGREVDVGKRIIGLELAFDQPQWSQAGLDPLQRLASGGAGLAPDLQGDQGLDRLEIAAHAMPQLVQQQVLLLRDLVEAGEHRRLLGIGAAKLQQRHDLPGQRPQCLKVGIGKRSRLMVEHAQRSDRPAIRRLQRHAGIEADEGLADDHGMAGEALVLGRILQDEEVGLEDRLGVERHVGRGREPVETDLRLEAVAVLVDQGDRSDRRPTDLGDGARQVVERLAARGVETTVAPLRRKAL
jgi:hypothetical protein